MYIEIQIKTIWSFDARRFFFFPWGTYIHANNLELTKSLWYTPKKIFQTQKFYTSRSKVWILISVSLVKIIDKVTISLRNCTFGQDHVWNWVIYISKAILIVKSVHGNTEIGLDNLELCSKFLYRKKIKWLFYNLNFVFIAKQIRQLKKIIQNFCKNKSNSRHILKAEIIY